MVKKTWLLCLLFLFGISALPVQSQATPAPTPVTSQATNPTADNLHDCGLPLATSQFTSASSFFTFNMTADCTYGSWSVPNVEAIIYITSGAFTINGNGHVFNGAPSYAIYLNGSTTRLNLNNIIIQNSGGQQAVFVENGARLTASNVIFRNNNNRNVIAVDGTARAVLENVQFLNNRQATVGTALNGSAINAQRSVVTITNGIFRGNRNIGLSIDVIASVGNGASVTLAGCITFQSNVQPDGRTASNNYRGHTSGGGTGTVTASGITGACPAQFSYWLRLTPQKKSKKTATPRPSATARPLATTCIDLHQATGIAVHATYGLASGVQCQRLDGGGIGLQSIVEAGFIDAVDVWGYVEQGVEVCFPQLGELLFLDASMMPRAAAPLASTVVNGMTCGAIETPGSIVLMPR